MIVNLDVLKRLGMAGMLVFLLCLGEKWDFALFMGIWVVIELGFQLLMRWYT